MTGEKPVLRCESIYALHESGTKFYQCFVISRTGEFSCSVAVHHWGRVPVDSAIRCIPSRMGQSKIEPREANIDIARLPIIGAKKRNGYDFDMEDLYWEMPLPSSEASVRNQLNLTFKADQVEEIIRELKIGLAKEDQYETKLPDEMKKPEVRVEQPDAWGEW